MQWGKKQIKGTVYDLGHLDPFTFQVTPKAADAPTYNVRVVFGCHTFTREWLATDTPDFRVTDGSHVRCFCPTRHGHSLHLPTAVAKAANGKAYFGNQANFLIVENLPGLNEPYAIFFRMVRSRGEYSAIMDVQSAYPKPIEVNKLDKITFATLVGHTAAGRPIKRPKK